jgi:hypothetical protein
MTSGSIFNGSGTDPQKQQNSSYGMTRTTPMKTGMRTSTKIFMATFVFIAVMSAIKLLGI